MRCFQCQKFGHLQLLCKKKEQICSGCAEGHAFSECPKKEAPKCANCGGAHNAASRACGACNEIRNALVTKTKVSYRDSLSATSQEAGRARTPSSNPARRDSDNSRVDEHQPSSAANTTTPRDDRHGGPDRNRQHTTRERQHTDADRQHIG